MKLSAQLCISETCIFKQKTKESSRYCLVANTKQCCQFKDLFLLLVSQGLKESSDYFVTLVTIQGFHETIFHIGL